MKFTIIVPSFNSESTIRRCLDSLITQKSYLDELEIIVCDGGSNDNTLFIVENEYPDVLLLKTTLRSLVAQSEFAILHSSGTYITFVDSDDFVEMDAYKKYVDVINKFNPDIIAFSFDTVVRRNNSFETVKYKTPKHIKPGFYQGYYFYSKIQNNIYCSIGNISRCTKIVTRKLALEVVNFYNSTIKTSKWEDTFYSYPCFLLSSNVYIDDAKPYKYVMDPKSMSHSYVYDDIIIEELEKMFLIHKKIFLDTKKMDLFNQVSIYYVITFNAYLKSNIPGSYADYNNKIKLLFEKQSFCFAYFTKNKKNGLSFVDRCAYLLIHLKFNHLSYLFFKLLRKVYK